MPLSLLFSVPVSALALFLAAVAHAGQPATPANPASPNPAPANPAPASPPADDQASASDPDAELRALIPESARSNAESWAREAPVHTPVAQVDPATDQPVATMPNDAPLSATSPLVEIAGLDLPWPAADERLPVMEALAAESEGQVALLAAAGKDGVPNSAPAAPAAPAAVVSPTPAPAPARGGHHAEQIRVTFAWAPPVPEKDALESRFHGLSALATPLGKDQELPQVAMRANTDRQLLERLLRIYGYYGGEVLQTLGPAQGGEGALPSVQFDIIAGPRYRFGDVSLGHLSDTGADFPAMKKAFGITTGDPLSSDAIPEAITRLDTALGEGGYPFAKIGEPELTVDHAREEGDLSLEVTPGGQYRFGAIQSGNPDFLSSGHLQDIARFRPGQIWNRAQVDDLRRAVMATGIVSGMNVTPREVKAPADGQPGEVALEVGLTPGPLRTIAGEVGYDTAAGWRLAGSWENRNLFPPEGMLRLRGVAGTHEQLAGATFRRSNFLGRDRVLTVDLYAQNATLTAYAARKLAFATTYERQTTLLFQKPWVWSMGLEAEASYEREGVPSGVTTGRTLYVTTALPLRGAFDATDNLLDPHKGWRASLRISPEASTHIGDKASYARIQGDASAYLSVAKGSVLAMRVRVGAITAFNLDDVAPSRRFYAGGGGSIRGYGYNLVGPRNALGEPKGGRSLYEVSLEARLNTGLFGGALQLVPFLDGGGVDSQVSPGFRDMRYGAGLGVRYKTSFGPIRLDVGTPLNRRAGDGPVAVYVALGQSF